MIDQIVAAVTSVEGARLLDRSSDLDHNRTVLTFAGSAKAPERQAGHPGPRIRRPRRDPEQPRRVAGKPAGARVRQRQAAAPQLPHSGDREPPLRLPLIARG